MVHFQDMYFKPFQGQHLVRSGKSAQLLDDHAGYRVVAFLVKIHTNLLFDVIQVGVPVHDKAVFTLILDSDLWIL